MRERVDVAIIQAEHDRAHGGVGAFAFVVAIIFHGGGHVINALSRQAWHLLISREVLIVA